VLQIGAIGNKTTRQWQARAAPAAQIKFIKINPLQMRTRRVLQSGAPLAEILQHPRIEALQPNTEGLLDAFQVRHRLYMCDIVGVLGTRRRHP
jgi:hypothetical protein